MNVGLENDYRKGGAVITLDITSLYLKTVNYKITITIKKVKNG